MSIGVLFLIGRILFGGYFFFNGSNHLMKTRMMAGYAASKGVPAPKIAVIVSGLLIFLGGLGVLLGVYTKLSLLLIATFLVVVSFKMHAYWRVSEPNAKMSDMINFTKNMALLGANLMMLSVPTPWEFSVSF